MIFYTACKIETMTLEKLAQVLELLKSRIEEKNETWHNLIRAHF